MTPSTHFLSRLLALALLAVLAGCGDSVPDAPGTDGSLGAELYLKARCDTCHGPDGKGLPRVGPALEHLVANWSREELASYMLDPAPFRESKPHLKEVAVGYFGHMRPFPELDEVERGKLADWLLARP